jgi:hypothetical protein
VNPGLFDQYTADPFDTRPWPAEPTLPFAEIPVVELSTTLPPTCRVDDTFANPVTVVLPAVMTPVVSITETLFPTARPFLAINFLSAIEFPIPQMLSWYITFSVN